MLSRGYKRSSKGYQQVECSSTAALAGDEPLQIKKKFPGVKVSVDKNRVRGCNRLAADGAKLVVLDDAFQYNRLHANLNIVLVDYSRPVFSDSLLPFGRLRDLPQRLFDADIIIVSKCPSGIEDEQKMDFCKKLHLQGYNTNTLKATTPKGKAITLLFSTIEYCNLEPVFAEAEARYTYSQSALIFTGIANDSPLKAYLSDTYKIASTLSFPDHHKYSAADISRIASTLAHYPTSVIVTTEKDAQRLPEASSIPSNIRERLFMQTIKANFTSEKEKMALLSELDRL